MKIDCPASTLIHRRMPKEAFYKHMTLTSGQRDRFVSDIDKIFAEYSFTADNLHLQKSGEIKEIILLQIEMRTEKYDAKILEAIARQNPHKLVFLLKYNDVEQLAIYHTKLYRTDWMLTDGKELAIHGFTLDDVWNHLIEQVALTNEEISNQDKQSLDDRLKRKDEIEKLEKVIKKLEATAWKEQQPKKKFDTYNRLQKTKEALEELKNG